MTTVWDGDSWETPAAPGTLAPKYKTYDDLMGDPPPPPERDTLAELAAAVGDWRKKRVSTGAIAGGASAEITVTWPTAFADANYTVTTSIVEGTAGANTLRANKIVSKVAASILVRVENVDTLTARTGEIHAIAVHD